MRSGSYLRALPILLLVFSLALPAVAQEQTGSVEGTVVDGTNAPVPGVTVTVRSEGDGFVRTVVTNTRGVFRVPAVPPGRYEISAELDGFQRAVVADAQISLGERLNLNFTIQPEAVEDVIEVTAEAPIISVTQSDTSAVISQEWVENLPVGRDFTSVVTQVPSANDEQDALGGISIDGASGAENRFIVDGMDTTNLQDGTSEKTLVTNFLEEVQVKASGYNAEFGGSTGGVISAVTKSGTNQWKGEVHGYYEESGLLLDERSYTGFTDLDNRNRTLQLNPTTGLAEYVDLPEDDFSRFEPGFTLGGPIYSDKVWFFAGYSPTSWEEERTITFLNDDVTNTFTRDNDYDYATANVTANLGPVYLKASFNLSDRERDNTFPNRNGTGSSAVEDYDVDEEKPNESWSLNADWLVNSNVAINARAGHFEYDTQETGFFTGIWHGFSTFSAGTPGSRFPNFPSELDRPLGNISPNNLGTLFDFFERDVITADVTFFADGFLGEHEIKVGGLVEDIGNSVVDGYTNTRILFYWDIPVTTPTGPRRGEYGYYRVLQIATQGDVSAENSAFFIQDSWRPTSRLTLNIGIRAEEENIPSFAADPSIPETAIAFDFDDKIAPRLGFAYDIKGDGRWKLYGSYGIFYDNTKLEMPRGSCGGDK
ncbi:MAG: carboxypeptidase regulatory-like domain-containing protein, partial [Holophagales bacterium]|nr:carboxypeptidase regulatory-like domain-containing protein [Holophagales bacterium]